MFGLIYWGRDFNAVGRRAATASDAGENGDWGVVAWFRGLAIA